MGKSSRKSVRLFVSIEPPRRAREALLGALRERIDVSNARVVPVERVHMTLQFIGEKDVQEMDSVMESVARSVSGLKRFMLTAHCLIQLPERGRPRLVAAETDAPAALLELRRRLAHRLARHVRRDAGDRFRPHLTLFRYRRVGRLERFDEIGDSRLEIGEERWEVDRVLLISSVLRAEGAEHREVESFTLE